MPEQAILSATPSKPTAAVAKVARLTCPAEARATPDRPATLHTDLEAALGPLVGFDVMAPETPGGCSP